MDPDDATIAELKLMKLLMVLTFAGTFWALFFIVPQARTIGIVLAVLFLVAPRRHDVRLPC